MWAAASQMRDHLLQITYSFAESRLFKRHVNNNQCFATKDFMFTQALLGHYWGRLLKEYVSGLIKGTTWRKLNDELDDGDFVWMLKDFTPRGMWPLRMVMKAHRDSRGLAGSFDIRTAIRIVQRTVVTLSRVFPRLSKALEVY